MHGDVYDFLGGFISPLMVLFTRNLITRVPEMITRYVNVFKGDMGKLLGHLWPIVLTLTKIAFNRPFSTS